MAIAEDYRFDYTTEYFLNSAPDGNAHVIYTITLTKKNPIATIDKYSLAFPDIFAVHNLTVNDEVGSIAPTLDSSRGFVTVTAFFNNPSNIDVDKHVLRFEFDQENIASQSAQQMTVQIPTIVRKDTSGSYKIILHPLKQFPKLIHVDISANLVTSDIIVWLNPTKKLLTTTFQSTNVQAKKEPTTFPSYTSTASSFGFIVALIVIILIYASHHKKYTGRNSKT